MKIATGNDLPSGDVVWWDGTGWSRHIEQAVDVGDGGEAMLLRETAACRVNNPYLVEAEESAAGPRPLHIKERIRARGPTVRLDLNLKPLDTAAGSWVI